MNTPRTQSIHVSSHTCTAQPIFASLGFKREWRTFYSWYESISRASENFIYLEYSVSQRLSCTDKIFFQSLRRETFAVKVLTIENVSLDRYSTFAPFRIRAFTLPNPIKSQGSILELARFWQAFSLSSITIIRDRVMTMYLFSSHNPDPFRKKIKQKIGNMPVAQDYPFSGISVPKTRSMNILGAEHNRLRWIQMHVVTRISS